jgi:hypothetical protein
VAQPLLNLGAERTTDLEGGGSMLASNVKRGFPKERLESLTEPKLKRDDKGIYIMTLSENVKVYIEDYYTFLEELWQRAAVRLQEIEAKLRETDESLEEAVSYYRSQRIIYSLLLKTIRSFYADGNNLGVIMTPWCFGTVILEKVESYKDRLSRGQVEGDEAGDYPYYVVRYIEETYKKTLLDVFSFPPRAFSMRWQYSELLKRYSKTLTKISTSLQSVLLMIRNYTS